MDTTTVRMQDDVDEYVNSKWKSENPIPDIYPRYTNFTVLHENLEKQKIEICQDADNKTINKLFDLYCNQTNEETKSYIEKKLSIIQNCQTKQELINLLLSQINKGKYLLFHVCPFRN